MRATLPSTAAPLPKTDIHLHAETSARVDRLLSLREGRSPYNWQASVQRIQEMPPGVTRLEAMSGEPEVADLDRLGKCHFAEWVADALYDAAGEGAVLVEVRFGAGWVRWPDLMPRFREAERLVQSRYPGFCAEVIISGIRTAQPDVIDACLEAREAGLAGVDLFPTPYDTEAGPDEWKKLYSGAERAADVGLGITIHAGEFSPANIRRALGVPGVTRIGHAVHAAFDNALLDELGGAGVTVECCLTSNVVLGVVPSLRHHPIRTFVDAGIRVTLCSDDPVSLNTTIGREYDLAMHLGFSASDLREFTRNGIASSFTSTERKRLLMAKVTEADPESARRA